MQLYYDNSGSAVCFRNYFDEAKMLWNPAALSM